jgi:hypothetical protein
MFCVVVIKVHIHTFPLPSAASRMCSILCPHNTPRFQIQAASRGTVRGGRRFLSHVVALGKVIRICDSNCDRAVRVAHLGLVLFEPPLEAFDWIGIDGENFVACLGVVGSLGRGSGFYLSKLYLLLFTLLYLRNKGTIS